MINTWDSQSVSHKSDILLENVINKSDFGLMFDFHCNFGHRMFDQLLASYFENTNFANYKIIG